MIQTGFESRVKIQQIIENQLPEFILDESPKVIDFLKQYYISQEYQSGPVDIAENLDQYLKLDNLTPEVVVDSTFLQNDINSTVEIITVTSTKGFPQKYGLLKIDDEVITYTGITTNTFTGCIRGFSGITNYHNDLNQEELIFSKTISKEHKNKSSIQNLSSLFLKEFYKKLKYTFAPGLEEVDFVSNLNVGNFIRQVKSLYQSKGTNESFRILFNVLYGVNPRVVNLEEFLIKPSSAKFIRREIVIVERISGDPSKLLGQTIQKSSDTITSASISEIEPFLRNNRQYYKISLFVGYDDISAVKGNFEITPNTRCLETVSIGSSVISVDSTIGFPEKGKIISGNNTITYQSKSINQFFECSGIQYTISTKDDIRSDEFYYGYENGDLTKKVELRLTGVLSKFVQTSDSLNLDEGQIISIKSIGDLIENPETNQTYKQIFANSWIYNTRSRYQIKDGSTNYTLASSIDKSSLKIGDEFELLYRESNVGISTGKITTINFSENRINIVLNPIINLDSNKKYDIRRKLNTASSLNVPIKFGNNTVLSDIQNLYVDDEYAYVASNSLPSNGNNLYTYQIEKNIKSIFGIGLTENYTIIQYKESSSPFITGDRIYYQPSGTPIVGLDTGDYYVENISNPKGIRLYFSKSFIGSNNYITFTDSFFSNSLFDNSNNHKFTLYSQKSEIIGPQKLLKKFRLTENINTGIGEPTIPGSIGMLINGVEINNYKSDDKVYYGPLESIDVLNGGRNFDVINPPVISISSGTGTTALAQPVISGSIQKIYIDSQDYDINKIVSIGVSGGNGSGAILNPIVTKRQRSILFDGRLITNSGGISTSTRQLTFINNHNLNNGEPLIYNSNGNLGIGIGTTPGTLVNNSTYYVKLDSNKTVRLYPSILDYNSGINTISFNGNNTSGIHKFTTASYKNTISEIKIIDGGEYTNRKLIVSPTGISTIYHNITFKNHGFESGELVNYNYQTSTIGISTLLQYYVLKENENSFRLCDAGIGGTDNSNYNRKNYIRFSSSGSGYQYFSYPDISVSILYSSVGFGTTTQTYQSLVTTPVVRGKIIDVYLYESGTGYGSTIINLEKKPLISIKNGREAQLTPIIINGEINSVNIQYSGIEYYSIPDLIIEDSSGSGSGADLRAVIVDGKITDVKIVNSGIGYSSTSTIINVKSSGKNSVFNINIRSLTVNNNYKFGDELLFERENQLQYSVSGYFEKLRTSFNDNGSVSKIIGWSYDGNPIYGPYGYTDPENSNSIPKLLSSGYELKVNNVIDRPSTFAFAPGFFVEDYTYTNSGDLDENNGRFGKTPEFPNGIYAYFATLDSVSLNPKFPYFIGDKYRTNTLEENSTLNQSFDFNNSDLLRNTLPYKISDNYADNDFIIETSDFTNQESIVESVTSGNVSEFSIINHGSDYKVNDVLNFDDTNTGGGGLTAKVSSISGKDIVKLETSIETYENSIFSWNNDNQIKVTILPNHSLFNNDFVTISGFSTNLSNLNNSYKIQVSSYYTNLLNDIPATSISGLTTEIYVTQIPIKVSVGSSISIGSEKMKVLEVFENINIIKVERGSTGVSHTATTLVNFIPDSFTISEKIDYFDSKVNNKVLFNPTQSVGVGTTAGITNSITFKFGNSNITRIIPTQGIYIENHPFSNNQPVIFSYSGSNISISTSPTGNQFDIPTNVYVTNKNKNIIGIKTNLTSSEVYFRSNGYDNNNYSIETQYSQIKGKVDKIKSTVSLSTYHGLNNNDIINLEFKPSLSVGIGTSVSIYVKRYLNTGNILINPIGFNSTGINTSTNTITINSHNLKTGDKILYSSDVLPSGLSTDFYYVYKVDNNNIKVSKTYIDSKNIPPTVVSIASTGGSNQSISLVNPQISVIKNNNLVFNLSDSSLSGYKFKLYYDKNYKNEFVSIATTSKFILSGIGTVGVSSNASITINYDEKLPTKLYYNLEKSGNISTSDTSVNNYSEILFEDSDYNSTYNISGIGSTTFNISLKTIPQKLTYYQNECDILKYNTNSISAKGSIHKINIVSGGSGYKKFPIFIGSNSNNGKDAYIIPKSKIIGNIKELRIINEGFEYSSDKTLQPIAYISPLISIKNSNTIDSIIVLNGGNGYINAPNISIVNSTTGKKINSGIFDAKLLGNSINSVNIIQYPKGLPETTIKLVAENNTNGISIQKVESSSSGIFTCFITTPILGFNISPYNVGDKVFIEGIKKVGSDGSGFNSENYGYQFFNVTGYDNSGIVDKVTISLVGLTTNPGTAEIIQNSTANIIKSTDYPEFKVLQTPSLFNVGEKLSSQGIQRDLKIISSNKSFIKVFGSYKPLPEEVIIGNESGNIATINEIEYGSGKFKVDYSVEKNLGWIDDIGKLSQDNQVIPDNDYYQNLSYTVKSPITYQNSKTPINSLLHTIGLKNFSDTGITSTGNLKSTVVSSKDVTSIVYDIIEENRVDTIYDFDFVIDVDVVQNFSKFLKLKNKKLADYIECKTNVVLKIDDISRQFSNLDGEPSEFINLIELNSGTSYNNILVRVSNYDNSQIQLSELIILNDGNNAFIAEKSTIANSGIGITHIPGEEYGSFSIEENNSGKSYLQFIPNDPYSIDYDIKVIKSNFDSSSVGIGTTSIGFINLTGSNKNASPGISTSIISVNSSKFSSLIANVQVIDLTSNSMNFVEVYLNHDGTNTYISQYYFDSEFSSNNYSGNFIGSFSSNISSGILSLNYTNNSSNLVNVRSSIVGFGTTAVGSGIHRFILSGQIAGNERSVIYQSTHSSTVSSASTVISLNKSNFNAIKSIVEVSVGSTSALHQVLTIHDNTNIYVKQSPFISIGSTSGIGTFGGEYSGNNFELKFYPDSVINSQIKILSFNQCLYSTLDSLNIAPNFTYGTVTDSIDIIFYNAINGDRINRLDFDLKSDNIPIFVKIFNPEDSLILNRTTGIFSIKNHFFSPSEELIYTPKSTFIGVGQSSIGIGATLNSAGIVTTLLPSDVYVIKISEDQFKLSTRKDYALLGIGVTFTTVGLGNAHQLEMKKKNEKSLITIDNIVQYPLLFTPIYHSLSGNNGQISAASSIFSLSGISSIVPRDIIKIDNEYMGIINVGLGTTSIGPITNNGSFNLIQVQRGFVGSSATSHNDSTQARIYKGSYNIVDNKIFFSESPRGNPQIKRDASNLRFETSDFTGRVFLRNNYTSNQIYDDISSKFTGIGRTFTLTVGGANTVGLGTSGGNGILFINGVFQTPTTLNNLKNDFKITENSGISSVIFSGVTISNTNTVFTSEFEVNQNQTPRGGIIISLGSSLGLGYAPLVGAAVTAVVGAGGSIVSIGIGTTDKVGSGYNGIVSIGVSVYESGHTGAAATISASIGAGGTLGFTIVGGGTGYSNPQIFVSEPSYENLNVVGISRLGIGATTKTGIGLLLNVEVGASSTTGIGSTYFEVSKFNISRQGYSFQRGDVFKPVGLVTAKGLNSPLSEFQLTVIDTFSDSFAAWQFGEFDFIDSIKKYQDGVRTRFPLFYNDELLSFQKLNNSLVNLSNALFIVVNGVIQDPEIAYQFDGGTSFVFTTAPKQEDNISVFFYKGTAGDDITLFDDIEETLKIGDTVKVFKNNSIFETITQDNRTIFDISGSDKFETNLYVKQGVDSNNYKPLSWNKQKIDQKINGELVYKSRDSLESSIFPTAKIIGDFSTTDTQIFVDNADFFKYGTPNLTDALIVSGSLDPVSAGITAVVSGLGTVQSLIINNPGSGYTGNLLTLKISPPPVILKKIGDVIVGVGSTAIATITVGAGGTLTTPITITNPGFGYTNLNPPKVIAPLPNPIYENISTITLVNGFSGIITGITTTQGIGGNPLALKFNLTGPSGYSGLQTGYPIYIFDTRIGSGLTSINNSNSSIVGIGTTFLDNIYIISAFSSSGTVGIITCNILSTTSVVGLESTGSTSNPVGKYSWGRLSGFSRSNSPISIGVTGNTIDVGLSTFSTIQRRKSGLRKTGALSKLL